MGTKALHAFWRSFFNKGRFSPNSLGLLAIVASVVAWAAALSIIFLVSSTSSGRTSGDRCHAGTCRSGHTGMDLVRSNVDRNADFWWISDCCSDYLDAVSNNKIDKGGIVYVSSQNL